MQPQGYIQLHRRLLNKGFYKRSEYVHLWIHLLLRANHAETEFLFHGKTIKLKPGQFVTGRKVLSAETGIQETTIERILELLENDQQIGQQKTNRNRVITILNWGQYQKTDNQRTTSGQPADTNNNNNNDNNKPKPPARAPERPLTKTQPIPLPEVEPVPNADLTRFFDLFKPINPSYTILFRRPQQRSAVQRLLRLHPLDWWERFMEGYAHALEDKYCPKASTPMQLEEKLGNIEQYARSKRAITKTNVAFT